MRGGYPVRVVQRGQLEVPKGTTRKERLRLLDDPAMKWYWCVDAGMIGSCGHKHRTEESATKCLAPMTLKYRETRWPGSTKKEK